MPLNNNIKISKSGNAYILYDATMLDEPVPSLFNPDYHTNRQAQQSGGIGRAQVVYFSQGNRSFVLKHYHRGGALAAILKDRYFGFSIIKSRAFREFRLLKKMAELDLPVPVAIAAHVRKKLLFYRADLITQEIKNSRTLADVLSAEDIQKSCWQAIGRCIKRFHQHNVYHADLNARNILLGENDSVYLIDFDNSDIRYGPETWKRANLARLQRSLLKFKNNTEVFNFDDTGWAALLQGYQATTV